MPRFLWFTVYNTTKFTSESEAEKCENGSAFGEVMHKSMVANFRDSHCSIQALIKVRQSYNYTCH